MGVGKNFDMCSAVLEWFAYNEAIQLLSQDDKNIPLILLSKLALIEVAH